MQMNFLIIPENKVENVFMVLDELFSAFQIYFHHYKYHDSLKPSLLKIAWWINTMCY